MINFGGVAEVLIFSRKESGESLSLERVYIIAVDVLRFSVAAVYMQQETGGGSCAECGKMYHGKCAGIARPARG